MKTLYLECSMGAAGDMLTAALLELHPDPADFLRRLNALDIPHVTIHSHPAVTCGITGTHVTVAVDGTEEHSEEITPNHMHAHTHAHTHAHEHKHDHSMHHHHAHTNLHDIAHIVGHLNVPQTIRDDILAVYTHIAEAESHAHGKPVDQIHFHEVGTMDAIADVTAVCMLVDELAPNQILASPIHVGSGHVRCAHGILPVPAPATAYILRGVPIYGGSIRGELCTPTGAALLRHFVTTFGEMPVMNVQSIGYGIGSKEFEAANCVRAMLGETADNRDTVSELCCNLDDMTAEAIGFATEQLLSAGALDVTTSSIQMKKNRPGTRITCMCRPEQREKMIHLLFRHTTTLGVREYQCQRYVLTRTQHIVDTPYGPVHVKRSSGWNVTREKEEYDDVADIARREGLSFSDVVKLVNTSKK